MKDSIKERVMDILNSGVIHYSKSRMPHTYHHDYIIEKTNYILSRSDVAYMSSSADDYEMYGLAFIYLVESNVMNILLNSKAIDIIKIKTLIDEVKWMTEDYVFDLYP